MKEEVRGGGERVGRRMEKVDCSRIILMHTMHMYCTRKIPYYK